MSTYQVVVSLPVSQRLNAGKNIEPMLAHMINFGSGNRSASHAYSLIVILYYLLIIFTY